LLVLSRRECYSNILAVDSNTNISPPRSYHREIHDSFIGAPELRSIWDIVGTGMTSPGRCSCACGVEKFEFYAFAASALQPKNAPLFDGMKDLSPFSEAH
jgi:hypothetical protein